MLKFGNKEFRNLQEQVGKNKIDIEAIKTGLVISYTVSTVDDLTALITSSNVGKYVYVSTPKHVYLITKNASETAVAVDLGSYPAQGPTGATGATGSQGVIGATGYGIYGVSSQLPSATDYRAGDWYLLTNGNLYKCKSINDVNSWVMQCSLKGPQGIQGDDSLTTEDREMLDALEEYVTFDEDGNVTFGADVTVDGDINVNDFENIVNSDDETLQDALDGKQATLNSGVNIKTVNNNSLLGSGNITIEGGGGSQMYLHTITSNSVQVGPNDYASYKLLIINNSPTAISNNSDIKAAIKTYPYTLLATYTNDSTGDTFPDTAAIFGIYSPGASAQPYLILYAGGTWVVTDYLISFTATDVVTTL